MPGEMSRKSSGGRRSFDGSPAAARIRTAIKSMDGCEEVKERLTESVLEACYQATLMIEDGHAVQRKRDSSVRQEVYSPPVRRMLTQIHRLLRKYPAELDVSLAFAFKRAGISTSESPSKALGSVLESLKQEPSWLSRDNRTGGLAHRQRHYNLLLPKNIDAGRRNRKLPGLQTCLAFELELLFRCSAIGWEKTAHLRRFAGVEMPHSDHTFYHLSVDLAGIALASKGNSMIDPESLRKFIRTNPQILLMGWEGKKEPTFKVNNSL